MVLKATTRRRGVLGVVGVPLALPECLWRPPGRRKASMGVLGDEAVAIDGCRAGTRAGQAGTRGAGGNWTRNRAAKAQSWLNQERETEKREVTKGTHGGGMDPRRGGNCDPRGSAHHHGDACGLHTLPPLLVHDRMGPCLRAPPLLSPASLLDCNA